MLTFEDLEARRYTYCQTFFQWPSGDEPTRRPEIFLVPTHRKKDAKRIAWDHATRMWGDQVKDICLYPGNYIIASRALLSAGKVAVDRDAPPVPSDLSSIFS